MKPLFIDAATDTRDQLGLGRIVCSTYRHADYADSSRLLTGRIIEDAIHYALDEQVTLERTVYEPNSVGHGVTATFNLDPFCSYVCSYESEFKYIPWWLPVTPENHLQYLDNYNNWTQDTLSNARQSCAIDDINDSIDRTRTALSQSSPQDASIGLALAATSARLVEDILDLKPSQLVSYASSKSNEAYLKFTFNAIKRAPNDYRLSLSNLFNSIGWCFLVREAPESTSVVSLENGKWITRSIKEKTGRKSHGREISDMELCEAIEHSFNGGSRFVATGFYTDVARVLLSPEIKVFHLGNDRGGTEYAAGKIGCPQASSLQLISGKGESYDPFETQLGRKFSLLEASVLRRHLSALECASVHKWKFDNAEKIDMAVTCSPKMSPV